MAGASLGRCSLLFLLLAAAARSTLEKEAAERTEGAEDPAFLSEYFSQSSQLLSFYSWYGSARIFRFRVPEDTVQLRWLLQASRDKGPGCGKTQVTFHIRFGAPPVINPLGTQFPVNTSVPPSFSQTLTLDAALQNSTFVNLTNPAAGDWFLAAHLPPASSKIEMKGFSRSCSYIFQPDLFVLRQVDVVVLEPDVPVQQVLSKGAIRPLHAKIFVPEYTAGMRFELGKCTENGSAAACPLRVTLGLAVLSWSSQKVLHCLEACSIFLASPPWGRWVWITVETLGGTNASVSFEMAVFFIACKPGDAASFLGFYQSLKQDQGMPMSGDHLNSTLLAMGSSHNASGPGNTCLRGQPVVREELDVASVRFRILGDSTVPVQSNIPTLLLLNLNSGMDSGGNLVLNLMLNQTSGNATVLACLSPTSPALFLNGSGGCWTAFAQGYLLNVSMSSREAAVIVPYPQTGSWYLSLKLLCPKESEDCDQAQGQVAMLAYLTPCYDDCGTYGQCSLMRRHGYLYTGCICKAVWVPLGVAEMKPSVLAGQWLHHFRSTHTDSIWHILVAISVAFLLPPGDKQKDPWAWSRKLLCHYQIIPSGVLDENEGSQAVQYLAEEEAV